MGDCWGKRIRLTIFGESHGPGIGIVVDGLPAGLDIDMQQVSREMARRAPGQSQLTTQRRESDEVEVISGMYDGKTTGSAICAIIRNTNTRSQDYSSLLRPGHADWTALLKYKGHADMRGGGHFSGRLTAPLVFAGALAKQALARHGILVHGRITAIAGIKDETIPATQQEFAVASLRQPLAVHNEKAGRKMEDAILQAKNDLDSVGGIIEAVAFGVPGGLGNPFFDSVESVAASLFFSIPAVKGLEFGQGFALAALRGSKANDPLYMDNGTIKSKTNNNGGILGGITNGMPVVARVAIKPTASIAKAQESVDATTMEEATLETHGRHDPCIVPRAVPVVEAALALSLLDCLPCGGTV